MTEPEAASACKVGEAAPDPTTRSALVKVTVNAFVLGPLKPSCGASNVKVSEPEKSCVMFAAATGSTVALPRRFTFASEGEATELRSEINPVLVEPVVP